MIDLFTKLLIYLKDKKCKSSSLKLRKYIDLLKWGSLKSGTPWDSDSARTRLATYHRAGENSGRATGRIFSNDWCWSVICHCWPEFHSSKGVFSTIGEERRKKEYKYCFRTGIRCCVWGCTHTTVSYMCRPMSLLGVSIILHFLFWDRNSLFYGLASSTQNLPVFIYGAAVRYVYCDILLFCVCWGFELRSFLCLCSKDFTHWAIFPLHSNPGLEYTGIWQFSMLRQRAGHTRVWWKEPCGIGHLPCVRAEPCCSTPHCLKPVSSISMKGLWGNNTSHFLSNITLTSWLSYTYLRNGGFAVPFASLWKRQRLWKDWNWDIFIRPTDKDMQN